MRLDQLLEGVSIEHFRGTTEIEIEMVAYDSRQVKNGGVFVAISGFQQDGHDYIPQALANGARAVVVEYPVDVPDEVSLIRVENSRAALAQLASNWFDAPSQKLTLFGITGTNGKTTTTWMIRSILDRLGYKTGLVGTTGYFVDKKRIKSRHTTPESLDLQALFQYMLNSEVTHAAMEVSSHALKLHRVDGVDFNCAVLTTIGYDHLDFHTDLADYIRSKRILFDQAAAQCALILNGDPDLHGHFPYSRAKTFGFADTDWVHAANVTLTETGSLIDLIIGSEKRSARIPIPGRYNVLNALAAAAAVASQGIEIDAIVEGLAHLPQVPGRFERIPTDWPFTVIVDYAHTPDALENVLQTAREITTNRLCVVFGAGGDRDRSKRPEMGLAADRFADRIIITTDNPRTEKPEAIINDIIGGIYSKGKTAVIVDRRTAIEEALSQAEAGDTIVIAGKGHEDYQEIDGVRYHFSDQMIVRHYFHALEAGS